MILLINRTIQMIHYLNPLLSFSEDMSVLFEITLLIHLLGLSICSSLFYGVLFNGICRDFSLIIHPAESLAQMYEICGKVQGV